MTRVTVSKNVLQWAVDRSPKSKELEDKFPALRDWVNGESQPTVNQLSSFAKATQTPFGFFFLQEPPVITLPIPYFRTIDTKTPRDPSPNLVETVQIMQRRQAWLREYLIENQGEPLPLVSSVELGTDVVETASLIREGLRLKENWANEIPTWTAALKEFVNKVDGIGILISISGIVGNNTHRKLSTDEFRGFVLVDEFAPLVFINGSDAKAAQMFTLAHELAHVWVGRSAAFDLKELRPANDEIEKWANQVAAEFLVPEANLRKIWKTIDNTKDPFLAGARHFKVSEIVVARRALDLGYLNKGQFLDFYRSYINKERSRIKKGKGGDFFASQNYRVGRRFGESVVRAVLVGDLLYRDAYRLTGLSGKTFETFSNKLLEKA